MNPNTYTPRADSVAGRVINYFQRNPDEELGLDDITTKFETTRGNIHTLLGGAVDSGMLLRARDKDGDYIYKPGPSLPKPSKGAGVDMDLVHRSQPFGRSHTVRKAPAGTLPDPQTVQIEDGIPITGKSPARDWLPLLQRMQPGQSFKLPINARSTMAKNITEAKKLGHGDFTLRVWRTA